jgi:uncharacterized protein (TIGR04551 family)
MMVNLDVTDRPDASGNFLFPVPLQGGGSRDTLNTANLRFRIEPTLNVSEHVRVKAQLDVLDNRVLGSSNPALSNDPGSPFPVPFYGTSPVVAEGDPRQDRPAISPKRAWAEVQTPVGLLAFGRMPSEWGLGVLTHAGAGIDDDFGDTVDRIQFALPPVSTPVGRLVFVPILDFNSEGVLNVDPRYAPTGGVGQPFDAESGDDGRTYGLKIARLDTEDEIRRKLDRGGRSLNYGLYYNYRSQRWSYPTWDSAGLGGAYGDVGSGANGPVHRKGYAHVADLWLRWLTPRLKIELELAGIGGHIGDASSDPAVPSGDVLLRQWGGSIVAEYQASPNRFMFGGEMGIASGDDAPGFGNVPSRVIASGANAGQATPYGSLEGVQWRAGTDRSIRNFRFNPAYRVDLVLFRHVLGQVTDALYVKPKVRWDILPGLRLDFAVVYSQAMKSESTPSSVADGSGLLVNRGHAALGLEADTILTYTSGDGFQAFTEWGVLQPLSGLRSQGASLARAHFLAVGIAARF